MLRDGGYSVAAPGGARWLFGDTVLARPDAQGSTWRHNGWSVTRDDDASDGLTGFVEPRDALGGARELFPQTDAERAFNEAHAAHRPGCADPCGARRMLWPLAALRDPAGGRLLLFYGKFGAEAGLWSFWPIGSSVAVWADGEAAPRRPLPSPASDEPTLLFRHPEPHFGQAAALDHGDVYAFGCDGTLTKSCKLGRVPAARVLERRAWRFWDGAAWSAALDRARPLFDGHTMLSVHHNARLDRWLVVYSEPLSTRVLLRTAERLSGPWSDPALAFEARPSHDGQVPYSALAHAELSREGGRFEYVTYFHSTAAWRGELRLVELELAPPQR